jgi:hypothetical protein
MCGGASSVGRSQPTVRRDCHTRPQPPPSADRPRATPLFDRDVNECRSRRGSCAAREGACGGRSNPLGRALRGLWGNLIRLFRPGCPQHQPPAALPPAAPPRTSTPEPLSTPRTAAPPLPAAPPAAQFAYPV